MDAELEIYTILRKHKLTLKKREEVIVDLLAFVEKDRTEQLSLCAVSQQSELLSWMKKNHHLGKTEEQINELLLDYNFEQLNCG